MVACPAFAGVGVGDIYRPSQCDYFHGNVQHHIAGRERPSIGHCDQSTVGHELFAVQFRSSDDLAFKDITVAFSFTAPPPPFGGGVTGETRGRFLFNDGILHWDGSINVAFGNGGLLGIQLFDTDFDLADNGQVQFEDVKAKFTLLLAPQQDAPAATPLPAELPLFAGGLGALGLLGWRRKKKAATLTA